MGLFGGDKKKGTDSLKTLSEKDIQSRLYGHLRNSDRTVHEDISLPLKPRQDSGPTNKFSDSSVSVKAASAAPSQLKTNSPDLFQTADVKSDSSRVSYRDSSPKEVRPVLAFKEQPRKVIATGNPQSKPFFQVLSQLAGQVLSVLKKVLAAAAQSVAVFFASVVRFVASIDFRQPRVRRFFYAAASAALLYFIFSGIQHLNKNREVAMKSPRKQAPSSIKKNQAKHPAQPLEAALTAVAADAQEGGVSAAAVSGEKKSPESPRGGSSSPAAKAISDSAPKKILKSKVPSESAAKDQKEDAATPAQPTKADTAAGAADAAIEKKSGSYVIQVATFATKEDAANLVQKFSASGFESFFKPVSRSAGRVYYCVFIGRFQTHGDADSKLAEFKSKDVSKPFQDAFVRSI